MSLLAISTVALCALAISYAAPAEHSARVDDLDVEGITKKSHPIDLIGKHINIINKSLKFNCLIYAGHCSIIPKD